MLSFVSGFFHPCFVEWQFFHFHCCTLSHFKNVREIFNVFKNFWTFDCFQLGASMGIFHNLSHSYIFGAHTYFCWAKGIIKNHSICVSSPVFDDIHWSPKSLYKFTFPPAVYEFLLFHIFLNTWNCHNLKFFSSDEYIIISQCRFNSHFLD